MTESAVVLRLSGITKRFGALTANDAISLTLARGEVLALLGENGAGKSTLVSILFGHYVADAGSIEAFGAPLPPGDPAAALAAGIGMVHQHFTLADNLDVLDNILVGTAPLTRPRLDRGAARERLNALAQRFGLAIDPARRVGELSVGEKQRVEILKALYRGARILILDEPTAVLTPQESQSLFATLQAFIAEGLAVIFISHKLDEVMAVADRVAVLRGGRLIAERAKADTHKTELAELMVGRSLETPRAKAARAPGEAVLSLRDVQARSADGHARLAGANLEVRAGEIVAIAGVAGNGQAALADLVFGLARPTAGRCSLGGAAYPASARAAVRAGIARVPEDRRAQGSVGDFALWENAVLEHFRDRRFSAFGLLRRGAMRAHARRLLERFDVRGPEADLDRLLDVPARLLSGGNLQKLIVGRALTGAGTARAKGRHDEGPDDAASHAQDRRNADDDTGSGAHAGARLLIADQPTWGLDIGAVGDIHARLIAARDAGDAVLVISEDLDEIFALADRIAVINHGRIVETRAAADWTLAELGLAMAERRAA